MSRLKIRGVRAAVIVLSSGLLSTGCGAGSTALDPVAVKHLQELKQEYTDVINSSLTLPSGVRWPTVDSQVTTRTPQIEGFGATMAQTYWFCAWIKVYDGAPRGSAAERRALGQLKTVTSLQLYKVAYDADSRRVTRDELAATARGNKAPLQREYRLNCVAPDPGAH